MSSQNEIDLAAARERLVRSKRRSQQPLLPGGWARNRARRAATSSPTARVWREWRVARSPHDQPKFETKRRCRLQSPFVFSRNANEGSFHQKRNMYMVFADDVYWWCILDMFDYIFYNVYVRCPHTMYAYDVCIMRFRQNTIDAILNKTWRRTTIDEIASEAINLHDNTWQLKLASEPDFDFSLMGNPSNLEEPLRRIHDSIGRVFKFRFHKKFFKRV